MLERLPESGDVDAFKEAVFEVLPMLYCHYCGVQEPHILTNDPRWERLSITVCEKCLTQIRAGANPKPYAFSIRYVRSLQQP